MYPFTLKKIIYSLLCLFLTILLVRDSLLPLRLPMRMHEMNHITSIISTMPMLRPRRTPNLVIRNQHPAHYIL